VERTHEDLPAGLDTDENELRLAPVPVRWHADLEVVIEQSAASSRTTHAASRPVDACRVLGAMVAALIRGEAADAVLADRPCPESARQVAAIHRFGR
jgi:ADP-ribosylglycohydrolase